MKAVKGPLRFWRRAATAKSKLSLNSRETARARAYTVSVMRRSSLFSAADAFSPGSDPAAALDWPPSGIDADARGAFYTRPEVVGFILDLIGYKPDAPLFRRRILEPSFGAGDFLAPIIERLLESFACSGRGGRLPALRNAIRAVELHPPTYANTRKKTLDQLLRAGFTDAEAEDLADHWLARGDFLLAPLDGPFDYIEEAGCRVGIGVATGADQAFVGEWNALDVESDRKLPLVTTEDIRSGEVDWRGHGVINPFGPDGRLVDLARHPRLKRYLEDRRNVIARRHCARKAPANWYRTIDRIRAGLAETPKLLVPDIKGAAHVVYEGGRFYPHHNLYYITAESWELRALQAALLSRIALAFVEAYSTRMRGGYLRFQAQYLRRIRLPRWADVPERMRSRLAIAAMKRDIDACDRAAFDLYGLDGGERIAIAGGDAGYAD